MKVGKISDNIWKRSIRKNLSSHMVAAGKSGAGAGRDVSEFPSGTVLGESMITPFCRQMGMLAVIRCVNAVTVYCKEVEGVMLSLMLDGRSSEEFAAHVAKEAGEMAIKLNTKIAGFDVHIIQGLKKPYIISYAVGNRLLCNSDNNATYNETISRSNNDEYIIATGYIGLSGTSIIADIKRDELINHFPEYYVDNGINFGSMSFISDHMDILRDNSFVHNIKNLSEGGMMSGLWDISDGGKYGLEVDLRKFPIRQETIEICNYYDINPYELMSDGCLLFTTMDGESLVKEFEDNNLPAVIIGKTITGNNKLIINEDEKRFLTVPSQDSVYEIV